MEGGVRHHPPPRLDGRRRPARPARLVVRGRRLRAQPRSPAPHRGRVGEGGDLGPRDDAGGRRPRAGSGRRASSPGTPASWRIRTASTARCSSTAATACCAAARGRRPRGTRRRRSATGTGPRGGRSSAASASRGTRERAMPTIDRRLGPPDARTLAEDVLDGLTRPFKELPPKHLYDARGSGAVRADLRAARVLPDPHRARDPQRVGGRHRRRDGRGRARRARRRLRDEDARAARRDARRGHARALPAGRRVGDDRRRVRRGSSPRSTRACEVHGLVGDFERHLGHLPGRRRARGSSRSSAGRSATSCRARGGASCARCASTLGEDGYLLLGTDLVKDPAVIEAAYDDSAGVTAAFNRNVLRGHQPRARRGLRPGRVRPRRVLRPRSRVDRDATAGAVAADRPRRARSTSPCTSPRARSCGPRSARSSRPSGWRPTSLRRG